MVAINWTVLVYLFIGLFALAGYFKGWWKEAITTLFLTFLTFLLQLPPVAQALINLINFMVAFVWGVLPDTFRVSAADFLEIGLGVSTAGGPPEVDAGDPQTWLVMLIIVLGLAILIGRSSLPASGQVSPPYFGYVTTWIGSLFGAFLGGLNGWLIISLIRAYLSGDNLPGGPGPTAASSPDVLVQAVAVPSATILDSFLPWFFMAVALVVFLSALKSRVTVLKDREGFRRIEYRSPPGYRKTEIAG
jgi:hypothetical protein